MFIHCYELSHLPPLDFGGNSRWFGVDYPYWYSGSITGSGGAVPAVFVEVSVSCVCGNLQKSNITIPDLLELPCFEGCPNYRPNLSFSP